MEPSLNTQSEALVKAIKAFKSILIYVKGSPDPDALASSFALKALCDFYGIRTAIVADHKLSLLQNRVFIKKLKIPLKIIREPAQMQKERFEAYAVLDHQSAFIEGLSGVIPCAVHIDHHEKIKEDVQPLFYCVSKTANSASTIVALFLKEIAEKNAAFKFTTDLATALLFGIQTDTDKYKHAAEPDYEAIKWLSETADSRLLNSISGVPMSRATSAGLDIAAANGILYKDWLISGIGYIDEADRDSIAIIADFLLKRENASVVFVYAIIKRKNRPKLSLDVSVRSKSGKTNLNAIIKNIASNGGARRYKGAFQVDLDFFNFCPDKQSLWESVSNTAAEAVKQQRDNAAVFGVKHFFGTLLSKKAK